MKIKTLALSVLLIAAVACGTSKPKILSGTVTFINGKVTLNGAPCNYGDKVKGSDEISTADKSIAVIQFGDTSIINLQQNTKIVVQQLLSEKGIDSIQIDQKSGSTFNKIVKKGTKYSLKTATVVAAVRGTSFTCSSGDKTSMIKLSTGYVKIVPVVQGKPVEEKSVELTAGNKIEAKDTGIEKQTAITADEQKDLTLLEKIQVLPGIENAEKFEEMKKLEDSAKPVVVPVEVISFIEKSEEPEAKPLTLKDIQTRYGTISAIKTTGGKEYIGAFKQTGDKVNIITTAGTVSISSGEISNVSKYKGTVK